jgi:hypothetical protein
MLNDSTFSSWSTQNYPLADAQIMLHQVTPHGIVRSSAIAAHTTSRRTFMAWPQNRLKADRATLHRSWM